MNISDEERAKLSSKTSYMIKAVWEEDGKKYCQYLNFFNIFTHGPEIEVERISIEVPMNLSHIPKDAKLTLVIPEELQPEWIDWDSYPIKAKKPKDGAVKTEMRFKNFESWEKDKNE